MAERNTYLDFLKGLAILGVVAIHTLNTNFDATSICGFITIAIRNLLNSCVPFFVAASGYFLYKKRICSAYEYKKFLAGRLRIVYIPMLIWSFPWLLLECRSLNNIVDFASTTAMYLIGGLSIFYFIALIVENYTLLPVTQGVKQGGVITLSIASITVTFVWTIINHCTGMNPPLVLFCSAPTYIGYFALGCFLGRTKKQCHTLLALFLVIVGWSLAIAENYYWISYHNAMCGFGLKPSASLMAFGVILFALSDKVSKLYKKNKLTEAIEYCGVQSMAIYMTHCLVIMVLTVTGISTYVWFLDFSITLTIDVAFVICLQKILPKNIRPFLGVRQ